MPDITTNWISKVRASALRQSANDPSGRLQIAQRLAELHALMLKAPDPVHVEYAYLPEDLIDQVAAFRSRGFSAGQWGWTLDPKSQLHQAVLTLVSEIRALDGVLMDERRQHNGSPLQAAITVGRSWYILSRGPLWRTDRTRKMGDPYRRRGLVYHRIIPQKLRGYTVRLAEVNDTRLASQGRPNPLGAAMFHGLRIEPSKAEGKFSVQKIAVPKAKQALANQVRQASAAKCSVLAWPELTMSLQMRDDLVSLLKKQVLQPTRAPAVIVTGSAHEMDNGRRVNRCQVLTAEGEFIARHDKIFPYFEAEWGVEDIVAGKEITVLVTRGPAMALGICKDFCDRSRPSNPYAELDVDLIVVPSMGRTTTAESHIHTIQGLKTAAGTSAFVVQQSDPDWPQAINYVIAPSTSIRAGTGPCIQGAAFSVHQWV